MRHHIATDDLRIAEIRPLASPAEVIEAFLPTAEDEAFISASRQQAERIMKGQENRLLVVVGPCSIHDRNAALEYADRLGAFAPTVSDALELVMRVYFAKPRTTVGWKGYINDPHLDESFDINAGLRGARELLLALTRRRIAAGTEFLDTIIPQYLADLISWGAIGARTTESQVHRELASGLSMPVGFKNSTSGSIAVAIDALRAARHPHHFLSVTKEGISAIVKTHGNDACHLILRGSGAGPNFSAKDIGEVVAHLEKAGFPPYVMVDCSHGNSQKDHRNQPRVAADIAAQIRGGSRAVAGVMIESHLVEGNQSVKPGQALTYGQSITDACLDWPATADALNELATAVRHRG